MWSCDLIYDVLEAHCYVVDIGRTDRKQIRSRIACVVCTQSTDDKGCIICIKCQRLYAVWYNGAWAFSLQQSFTTSVSTRPAPAGECITCSLSVWLFSTSDTNGISLKNIIHGDCYVDRLGNSSTKINSNCRHYAYVHMHSAYVASDHVQCMYVYMSYIWKWNKLMMPIYIYMVTLCTAELLWLKHLLACIIACY